MRDLSDPISRQQAITALRALSDEDGYINVPHEVVTDVVRGLPPVKVKHEQTTQPEQGESDKLGVKTGETYKDTISRQAAIDIIEDFPHGGVWNVESMEEMVYRIKQLPSAQPERKTGKWIDGKRMKFDGTFYWFRQCDQCGYERNDCDTEKDSNFCPNCGSYNGGEQE